MRRLALLCQAGRMVGRSEGQASGGLDVALGPNVGATPLALLGPGMIMQYLVAGSACGPASSPAALPVVRSLNSGTGLFVSQQLLLHRSASWQNA